MDHLIPSDLNFQNFLLTDRILILDFVYFGPSTQSLNIILNIFFILGSNLPKFSISGAEAIFSCVFLIFFFLQVLFVFLTLPGGFELIAVFLDT